MKAYEVIKLKEIRKTNSCNAVIDLICAAIGQSEIRIFKVTILLLLSLRAI